jgi:hypothetical protein
MHQFLFFLFLMYAFGCCCGCDDHYHDGSC